MASLYNVATIAHSALVLLFVAVTGLLMVVSALRRSRLRKIRLSWGNGRLYGLPLIPTIFLAVVVGLIGYELFGGGQSILPGWTILIGYLTGGVFWYIGALLSTSVVVTDWGLNRRRRGRSEALPWHEVTDYLVRDQGKSHAYVFFRIDERGKKQRFELDVPKVQLPSFRETVEAKLDARFNYHVRRPSGRRALKQ